MIDDYDKILSDAYKVGGYEYISRPHSGRGRN